MGIKSRIIPVLLFDEHGCVKGRQFSAGRRIGSMHDRLRLLERRDIDEIILLDISASPTIRRRGKRSPGWKRLRNAPVAGSGRSIRPPARHVRSLRRAIAS